MNDRQVDFEGTVRVSSGSSNGAIWFLFALVLNFVGAVFIVATGGSIIDYNFEGAYNGSWWKPIVDWFLIGASATLFFDPFAAAILAFSFRTMGGGALNFLFAYMAVQFLKAGLALYMLFSLV